MQTTFDIIGFLTNGKGSSLPEIARDLDHAKSTIHRHLRTLENLGYVVERDNGTTSGSNSFRSA